MPFSPGSVNHAPFWHYFPVSYSALPITDAHVLDIDRYDPDFLASNEAAAAPILNSSVLALKRLGRRLVESVVFEMLLAIILLLLCSTRH